MFSIALFNAVPGQKPVKVSRLACLYCSRAAPQLLEDRVLPVLVSTIVPSEDKASIVLLSWMPSGQFASFLDSSPEDYAEVHGDVRSASPVFN